MEARCKLQPAVQPVEEEKNHFIFGLFQTMSLIASHTQLVALLSVIGVVSYIVYRFSSLNKNSDQDIKVIDSETIIVTKKNDQNLESTNLINQKIEKIEVKEVLNLKSSFKNEKNENFDSEKEFARKVEFKMGEIRSKSPKPQAPIAPPSLDKAKELSKILGEEIQKSTGGILEITESTKKLLSDTRFEDGFSKAQNKLEEIQVSASDALENITESTRAFFNNAEDDFSKVQTKLLTTVNDTKVLGQPISEEIQVEVTKNETLKNEIKLSEAESSNTTDDFSKCEINGKLNVFSKPQADEIEVSSSNVLNDTKDSVLTITEKVLTNTEKDINNDHLAEINKSEILGKSKTSLEEIQLTSSEVLENVYESAKAMLSSAENEFNKNQAKIEQINESQILSKTKLEEIQSSASNILENVTESTKAMLSNAEDEFKKVEANIMEVKDKVEEQQGLNTVKEVVDAVKIFAKNKLEKNNSILELYNVKHVNAIEDHFSSLKEISSAINTAGLEKSQLIFGIDFTISNLENGLKTFNGRSLHYWDEDIKNPYQKVIEILGKTLETFDMDGRIPAFGFGDSKTKDRKVFSFSDDGYCLGFQDVLEKYNKCLKGLQLSGPTNFAPLIKEAIKIVKATKQYHILVIVADGQVTNERQTREAIVEASKYPISIIMVGVGDGPWNTMNEFDDSLPKRQFDNFQFVNYHDVIDGAENPDETFALNTLMEIPDQYKAIKELNLLD